MKVNSTFAILDVKRGRHQLARHFEERPALGPCPSSLLIPVTITGFIDGRHSRDDGESIEFSVQVDDVKVGA